MTRVTGNVNPQSLAQYNKWLMSRGEEPLEIVTYDPKKQYQYYVTITAYNGLQNLAIKHGFVKVPNVLPSNTNQPEPKANINALLEAIGRGDIISL